MNPTGPTERKQGATQQSAVATSARPDLNTLDPAQAADIGSALAELPLEARASAWRALFADPSIARSPVQGKEADAYNVLLGRSCIPWTTSSLAAHTLHGKAVGPYVVNDLVVVGEPTTGSTRGHGLVEAIVDGHRCMLKTCMARGPHQRYANPEGELVMHAAVARIGLPATEVRLVDVSRVPAVPAGLAPICLAVEFIDDAFARRYSGSRIHYGPGGYDLSLPALARLFAVDAVFAYCDRREANLFGLYIGDELLPVPFDHEQAARSALTDKRMDRRASFVKGYGLPRDLDMRLSPEDIGGFGNLLHMSIYEHLLRSEAVRAAVKAAIPEVVASLDDTFLQSTVSAIPPWTIPKNVVAGDWERPGYEGHRAFVTPLDLDLWGPFFDTNYARLKAQPLSGDALLAARKREVITVGAWRRDNLAAAIDAYFAAVPAWSV